MDHHETPGRDLIKTLGLEGREDAADMDEAALERGRRLFAQACDFLGGVVDLGALPPADLPEIAFAGRSNVGKSSLINALTGRRMLARTSHTPGRTREINFFLLGGEAAPACYLVDLPGYGYAKVSKAQSRAWVRMTNDYLRGRPNLRRVCLLIDSRHGLKESDRAVMTMFDKAAVTFQIVLTKIDKPKQAALHATIERLKDELAGYTAAFPHIAATSSHKNRGLAALRADLAALTAH